MKPKERIRNERRIENALREIFGCHLASIEFGYYRGGRKIYVAYEDFKPYDETRALVRDVLQGKWNLILRRSYSSEYVKNTLLEIYNKNRIAVVDVVNGELKPYPIRVYVLNMMMKGKYAKQNTM